MSNGAAIPWSQSHPGGCYLGFNAAIDRKSVEQIIAVVNTARQNGYSEINLCMSSVGGILDQTYYLSNMLSAMPIRFITWNIGNIQSAAVMLFLVGEERYATAGSTFFFHQTSYDPPNMRITEPYLTEKLKAVQYDDNRSATMIANRTGKLVQDVRGWQNTEMVMDTNLAALNGIIHAVKPFALPTDAFFHQIII
jgi:ATP-dependent Clp protease protease subunit